MFPLIKDGSYAFPEGKKGYEKAAGLKTQNQVLEVELLGDRKIRPHFC
jgi:hypothetical protein